MDITADLPRSLQRRKPEDQRMSEAQEEDNNMKDERKKRGRDQTNIEYLEEQASKYATLDVDENKDSINNVL